MKIFLALWRWIKYIWMLMTLQKHNFYREVNPMNRVYSQLEMIIFAFSITVGGTFFYNIPLNVLMHGDLMILFWIVYTPILFITAACFAEMAALMPAVGAHYHYCYSTICEFVAFLVGWNLILAYTTITMSRLKFLSEFIDVTLLGGWISHHLKFTNPTGFMFFCVPGYVDIISPILAISMAFQAAWAVNVTKSIVNLFTAISIVIMIILIVAFMGKMEFSSLSIENTKSSEKLYDALYIVHRSLVGYESLSVLGEEAKDPTTTIPLGIMKSVQILILVYVIYTFTMSICVKEQRYNELNEYNPLGSIVIMLGMPWMYWIVTLGSLCSLWCSAYGTMFIAIRILYAMSRDGMIFKQFSKIDRYTKKPSIPAIIYGVFTGLVVIFIDVDTGVSFFSLISAKIMTTVCLLITRFRYEEKPQESEDDDKPKEKTPNEDTLSKENPYDETSMAGSTKDENSKEDTSIAENPKDKEGNSWILFNYPNHKNQPTEITHSISMVLIYNTVMSLLGILFCIMILYLSKSVDTKPFFKISGFCCIIFCFLFSSLLRQQPTNDRSNLSFVVPHIPTFPLLAIAADFVSSLILCWQSWIYGVLWTALGILFYFSYSIRHSQESRNLYADGTRWNPLEASRDQLRGPSSWTSRRS